MPLAFQALVIFIIIIILFALLFWFAFFGLIFGFDPCLPFTCEFAIVYIINCIDLIQLCLYLQLRPSAVFLLLLTATSQLCTFLFIQYMNKKIFKNMSKKGQLLNNEHVLASKF